MRRIKRPHRLARILSPLGGAYAAVMHLRAQAFQKGLFRSWAPPACCVSIGNIRWGGTGKTQITDWLLHWCQENGRRPVVLTRGYGGTPPHTPYLVSQGSRPEHSGDEPLMLARKHPEAKIVVDPVRARAGAWAWEHFAPDLFILDDGFQHLAVKRNLDLVLLSPDDLGPGWNRVIPGGTWREAQSALHRAHCFLVNATGQDGASLWDRAQNRLKRFATPIFLFQTKAGQLLCAADNAPARVDPSAGYLLVTGIANPHRALHTASEIMHRPPEEHLVFPDHHAYSEKDAADILATADSRNCPVILTTPKDAVKLQALPSDRLFTLSLSLSFPPGPGEPFESWIGARLR
ncbi:MAG: tetraacyldisaccharide 4'-kinase [Desulfovibrionales bacterium]